MDTIAAISTGNQIAAIGILRLSGPEALPIADAVFRPADGKPLSAHPRRTMVYGALLDRSGVPIDHALAVTFAAGASYTGEDSAEFHCHGSPVVLQEGLQALFAAGARQATGGEFTKRAFLSGCMDLTEAEAVIDLIEAETADAARNAVGQLSGLLRREIEGIYDRLMAITSRFYAVVDYPDEDIEDVEQSDMLETLTAAESSLAALLASFDRGRVLKSGVPTAIIGRPNVGKSSLLNALVGYERAIVTDVAGTTRDTVEEKVLCGGVLLRLIDTAGIRATADTVEQIGVSRSRQAAGAADLCLVVLDGSQPLTGEDREALEMAQQAPGALAVVNKSDLPQALDLSALPAGLPRVALCAKTGAGLGELEAAMAALFPTGAAPRGQFLTNPRQAAAVERALSAVRGALSALQGGLTPDAVLTDAEAALSALGELTGKTAREDLVAQIFSRFCVGK